MTARLAAACTLAIAVLWLSVPASAQTGELVCPPSAGGLSLYSSFIHDGDLGHRSTLDCEYGAQMEDGSAGDAAYLVIAWDSAVDAGGEDGFTTMCSGDPDRIGEPSEISQWSADLQVLDSTIVSRTERAVASVRTWDYWDPPTTVDHEAFVAVARDLLAVAEARALDCAGGAAVSPSGASSQGRTDRRTAAGLLAAGAGLAALAGAGSAVAGRRPRGPVAPVGPPPEEVLYSGSDAIRILRDAGLLQEVRGDDGSLVGYRPVGDLERFIANTPQWQPEFGRPLSTPGGTATHLGAVAFEEHPDGLLRDLTIAVRELPGGAPAGPSPDPAQPAASQPAAQPPGEPLAERLGRAWARANAYGVSFESALEAPSVLPPVRPPTQPAPPAPGVAGSPAPGTPDASGPPASADQIPAWLSTPGWKSLKPSDVFRMFPQHFGPDGAIKISPFSGSVPKVTIQDGSFSAEVSSPLPFVPDVHVRGTLTPSPSGDALVPTIDEVTVGGEPYGDRLEHQRSVASHLNKLTKPVGDAGLRFGEVRLEDGELRIKVERPGG